MRPSRIFKIERLENQLWFGQIKVCILHNVTTPAQQKCDLIVMIANAEAILFIDKNMCSKT